MSEATTAIPAAPLAPEQPQEGTAPEPKTFDADYVDRLRKESAKYRTEAKANAEAAKRLTELEEAQKTAEQKAAERLAEMEKRAAELEAKATVAEIAASSGIPTEILAGPRDRTPEGVQEFATRLTAFLEERGKPRTPQPDRTQGGSGASLALNGDGIESALRAKLGIA